MRIRGYFKGLYFKSFLGAFCKLIETLCQLAIPFIMGNVIKIGILNENKNTVILLSMLILVLVVVGYLISSLGQYLAAKVAIDFGTKLKSGLFSVVNDFSFNTFDKFSSSSLSNRIISDTNSVQNTVNLTIRLLLRAPFVVIGSVTLIFIINSRIALILLIGVVFLSGFITLMMYLSAKRYRVIQKESDDLFRITLENITGSKIVRAFANEEKEEKRFEKQNQKVTILMKKLGKITGLSSPFTTLSINIVLIIMVYVVSLLAKTNYLLTTNVTTLVTYSTELVSALLALTTYVLALSRGFSARKRIKEVFYAKTKKDLNSKKLLLEAKSVTLKFDDVFFNYDDSNKNVVDGFSFSCSTNEIIGITGLTGSGKSSLINLIPRFYDVSSGNILINDINLKEYDVNNLRDKISFCLQNSPLLNMSIKDNITFGAPFDHKRMEEAIEIACATFIYEKKLGLDEIVLKDGSNFSGGEKKRLNIARTIYKDSPIIILDDSFSSLDYLTEKKIQKNLLKLKNKIIIIVSQRISTITNANKIILMAKGKIQDIGTHKELLSNSNLYKEISLSQGVTK